MVIIARVPTPHSDQHSQGSEEQDHREDTGRLCSPEWRALASYKNSSRSFSLLSGYIRTGRADVLYVRVDLGRNLPTSAKHRVLAEGGDG